MRTIYSKTHGRAHHVEREKNVVHGSRSTLGRTELTILFKVPEPLEPFVTISPLSPGEISSSFVILEHSTSPGGVVSSGEDLVRRKIFMIDGGIALNGG